MYVHFPCPWRALGPADGWFPAPPPAQPSPAQPSSAQLPSNFAPATLHPGQGWGWGRVWSHLNFLTRLISHRFYSAAKCNIYNLIYSSAHHWFQTLVIDNKLLSNFVQNFALIFSPFHSFSTFIFVKSHSCEKKSIEWPYKYFLNTPRRCRKAAYLLPRYSNCKVNFKSCRIDEITEYDVQ